MIIYEVESDRPGEFPQYILRTRKLFFTSARIVTAWAVLNDEHKSIMKTTYTSLGTPWGTCLISTEDEIKEFEWAVLNAVRI